MKTYKDLVTLIAACVEERKRFERSAVGYLEFLSTVERDHANLWKPACGTFDEFLERYVGLPRTSSYAEFKASLAAMGIEYVRECGAEAAAEAMRIVPAGSVSGSTSGCVPYIRGAASGCGAARARRARIFSANALFIAVTVSHVFDLTWSPQHTRL